MWTMPVGGGSGKIIELGSELPLSLQLAAYCNVVTPQDFDADLRLRFQLQFSAPKAVLSKVWLGTELT